MGRNSIRHRRRWMVLAATVAALPVVASASTTRNWFVGSGNWSTPGDWNPSGVPAAGDYANIINGDATTRTITYDYTGAAVTLTGIFLSDTSGGSEVLSMTSTGTALTTDFEFVGGYLFSSLNGAGVLTQSVGTNSVSQLDLGYNL